MLLLGVQVQPAGSDARLVGSVESEYQRGYDEPEGEHNHDGGKHRSLAGTRLGVQGLTRAAGTATHRDEEDREPEDEPEGEEAVNHRAAQYRSATLKAVARLLRGLPLSRLLIGCAVIVAVGIGASALALAVAGGPVPPSKPLAQAVHDALSAPKVEGVSARIQLTNHLLEGASLASGGGGEASQLSSSPLISGASGRLWIGSDGRARLELQSEKGDTQILYDGHNVSMYDASTNTLYRLARQQGTSSASSNDGSTSSTSTADQQPPSVAKIQEGIEHLEKHAVVSEATPTDIAGQAAYTVRVSPRETGSLIGGGELSWDAVHGTPLRVALYSTTTSSPVIELGATEISYGPVESSALEFTPPSNAKVEEVKPPSNQSTDTQSSPSGTSTSDEAKPHVTTHGSGISSIVLVESPVKPGSSSSLPSQLQSLPKVDVNGTSASELQTPLGTLLYFERSGVRYLVGGFLTPSAVEAFARDV